MTTFKDFYSRHRQKFFAYLIRRAGDYGLACDIMQESFTRLYEKYAAEHFTPQLLYTIGRNLVLDALRRNESIPLLLRTTSISRSMARSIISWCGTSIVACWPPCAI